MQNRRYHVHIICVAHEQPLVLDGLAVFFQSRAFLTYDVSPRLPQASLYGRQSIDACDYAIVVIGDSYGTTQNLGVSQMHLSYLSARAKLKPMFVLVRSQNRTADIGRQLHDFTRLVEQQVEDIYYYDDNTNIDELLKIAYDSAVAKLNVISSWTKKDRSIKGSITQSQVTQRDSVSNLSTSTNVSRKPNDDKLIIQPDESIDATDNITQSIDLSEKFDMQYSAQAYEGGNLTDITMSTSLTWEQILHALARMPGAFSNHGLQGCLNRLITIKADKDIKKMMPNVHAVSRCQIAQNDLNKLQSLLVAANWIQLTASGARTSQELWKLTFYAKKIFKDSSTQ